MIMNTPSSLPLPWLQSLLQDPQLSQFELVQSLWSDFGQLLRCYSPARQASVIIKLISQPATFRHPRGWSSQQSLERKWRSYEIEQYFYTHYAPLFADYGHLARLIASDAVSNESGTRLALVLSDLNTAGFEGRHQQLSADACKPVLAWLAAFHGRFIHQSPSGLWSQGSYWHLATRPDEFSKMAEGPLKQFGPAFDKTLQQCPYRTLIHGDAKVANFCFSADGQAVAAVDFQYVGGGIGVQDVAYFLGSVLSEQDLLNHTEDCLDYYFGELRSALSKHLAPEECEAVCNSWRQLYCVANADFHRFLAGWSPEHFKINRMLQQQTEQAIALVSARPQ
jgi:thiamine kinase-like enzyme